MKKIFIIAVVIVAISTVSCRKERTCECNTTETVVTTGYGAGTLTYQYSDKVTREKQKKKDFKLSENCYSYKTVHTYNGGAGSTAYTDVTTYDVKCEIK